MNLINVIGDWFVNIGLDIINFLPTKWKLNVKIDRNKFKDETIIPFNEDYWRKGLWWGNYSETEEIEYHHDSMVDFQEERLLLMTENKPIINHHTNNPIKFRRGVIMTQHKYEHSLFEVNVKVNTHPNIWCAPLWFVAAGDGINDQYDVLPEIDVCEFYTEEDCSKARGNSNIHYGLDYGENSKSIGGKSHKISKLDKWINYAVHIDRNKNKVKFYYNDILVRVVTSKNIVERLKYGVYPIIGSGINNDGKNHTESKMEVSDFIVYK